MKILKILAVIVAALVAVVAVIAGVASTRPDQMHIERSKVIAASPADLYPYANNFDLWMTWNPWNDLDPKQVVTHSESREGVGAWYHWKGNDQVGEGQMTITASEAPNKVVSKLEFIAPFQSVAQVTMTFTPDGEGTKVTWAMDEDLKLMSKVMGLFMDMDKMLGDDFNKGLNKLAPLAEAAASKRLEAEAAAAAAAQAAAAGTDAVAGEAAAAVQ